MINEESRKLRKTFIELEIKNAQNRVLYHLAEEQSLTRIVKHFEAQIEDLNIQIEADCRGGSGYAYEHYAPLFEELKGRKKVYESKRNTARILKEGHERSVGYFKNITI